MTTKKEFKRLIRLAERQSDAFSKLIAVIDCVAWELDSTLSNIRKDEAGYRRGNAANRDGGDNYVSGELEEATAKAHRLLCDITLGIRRAGT